MDIGLERSRLSFRTGRGRHHFKAVHFRFLRHRAFAHWREVTCAC